MCVATKVIVMPFYKALAVPLWGVLLSTLGHVQWERMRTVAPKDIAGRGGVQAGRRPMDRNWLLDLTMLPVIALMAIWLVASTVVFPAAVGYFPFVVGVLVLVPVLLLLLPLWMLSRLRRVCGLEKKAVAQMLREKPRLMLKIGAVQVVNTAVMLTWFAGSYFDSGAGGGWADAASHILAHFASISFDIRVTFVWPSIWQFPTQIALLALSAGVLASQLALPLIRALDLEDRPPS